LGPKEAAAWAREQALALAHQSKKPVMLKETGFPHGGKETYTPDTQKEFWSSYKGPGVLVSTSDKHVWVCHAVAFEAFDLPWKANASNLPIEAFWGLMSPRREPYPAVDLWKAAP
jgi:exo-beta-1,3-glucanase (GH17 family)